MQKAFEPFFTTKDIGKGSGLGLSQVYGFVTQSGGHVKIYSERGQGTTVKIYLPRVAEAAEERPSGAQRVHATGARLDRVLLVVEDEEDVRTHAVAVLRELGYTVLEARDAPEALEMLDANPRVHLLFTDVGLPGGMNGRQLAEHARARHPELRVLFTTGYARNAIVHQGRLDAGVELITKPFTYADLAERVYRILSTEPAGDLPGAAEGAR
jgi:CheY-like chemotaxis protein